ncbi:sodium-dependent transporter [Alkaliphilus peptidifermentans]|uniref:Transporter n=1 Tax=Alkaliphilus peptidifermentans DSM 18978 TaxID=1120976 RepID=A0A1G5ACH1_9FIRM|nr:sodium-dependent transporter [Alkaliphilus peptidifermentans]SCX75552.1 neurotransmitter:Na+ symporter, NSS family [Alkaliphilus peptidifermentans DSM 18978]
MKDNQIQQRDQWGSKIGFILAAAGSAVGLGNIWRFPFMAGANGGGAFVFLYFAILVLVGFTLMMAELTLGRHTQLSPVGAYRKLKEKWAWVGGLGVIAGFLILSFYSVIGGWVIKYIVQALTGAFTIADPEVLGGIFGGFITNPTEPLIYHAIFMILTLGIVIGGVKGGIEKYSKILMPALFVMMILIMFRSLTLPGAFEGVKFLLVPDFSKITGGVVLSALGQVFFSLSLGMGTMITYGSYLNKEENLIDSSLQIPLLDTAIALIAGLAILPAVFAFGFDPEGGAGLLFITLPAVFSQMPLGSLFGVLFFVLVLFAALTSSISLLEVVVAYVVDEKKWNRKKASIVFGGLIFLMGIPSSLGIGVWEKVTIIPGLDILDSVDFVASNILLPLGGLLLCIFIGWVWGLDNAYKEVTNDGKISFPMMKVWGFLVKWVAPIAIAIVFVQGIIDVFK